MAARNILSPGGGTIVSVVVARLVAAATTLAFNLATVLRCGGHEEGGG